MPFDSHKEYLRKIFKWGDIYKVPPNQRDYDWGQALLEYFWEDLVNSYDAKDKSYFFGSVIFQRDEDDNKVTIYDGQQRMATLTVLWAAIRDILLELKENESAQTIQMNFITQKTEKKKETPILTLNLRNKEFFYDCIQKERGKTFDEFEKINGKLNASNDKIKKCYLFFKDAINKECENRKYASDKEKIDFITDISEHLRENFVLVVINVSNEEEAYMIYEAINQKRL